LRKTENHTLEDHQADHQRAGNSLKLEEQAESLFQAEEEEVNL